MRKAILLLMLFIPWTVFARDTITDRLVSPVIYGSVDASGNLQIQSTINSTKGQISIGNATTGLIIDGVNQNVGIGLVPTEQFNIKLRADSHILIDGSTNPRSIIKGALRIVHKPIIPSTRAIHLEIDSNSQNDTMGIFINYVATDMVATDSSMLIEANVDTDNSTGGRTGGIRVSKTGSGTLQVVGLETDPGVLPIFQQQGIFGVIDVAFIFDGSFTNVTVALNDTGTDVQLFINDNDYLYIGADSKFGALDVALESISSEDILPIYEYSQGGASWAVYGPNDNSSGFITNGVISWVASGLAGWSTDTVNGVNKFWIRIQRTRDTITTSPTEDRVRSAVLTDYFWDDSGDVEIRNLVANDVTVNGTFTLSGLANDAIVFTSSAGALDTDVTGISYDSVNKFLGLGVTTPTHQFHIVLQGDENYLIDGRTNVRTITPGAIRSEHTAGVNSTRAYHIDIDSNGFDDTRGIVIRHNLAGSSNFMRPKGISLLADITGATNAHLNFIEFDKTGITGAGMQVDAIDVRGDINVIDHHSGLPINVDTGFEFDGSWTNITAAFNSSGTDVQIFALDSNVIYVGGLSQFSDIEVILAIVASNTILPAFEYSQGVSAWNVLSVSDGTNGFQESGNILFSPPGDWVVDTVNGVASTFWVRIIRTQSTLATPPTEDTIQVVDSINYMWDLAGLITVRNINLIGTDDSYFIGDLGVGITVPVAKLHVSTSTSGVTPDASADDVFIENGTTGGLTIGTPNANSSVIAWGSPGDAVGASAQWNYNADLFTIGTGKTGAEISVVSGNSVEAFRVDLNQNITGATLTIPTIGDFTNSNHNHSNTAGGGLITTSSIDHGLISGLADDDHTQYLLLAGRAGGQSVNGGTAASDDLTLDSTSDSTKGFIILQPSGGNVGIGTNTPAYKLQINSSAPNGVVMAIKASNNASMFVVTEDASSNGRMMVKDSSGTNQIYFDAAGDSYLTGGNVGIGTITPVTKFDVSETSGTFGGSITSSIGTTVGQGVFTATAVGSQTCDTTCANEDANAGYNSVSGVCVAAWNSDNTTSACNNSSANKICRCVGSF